MTGLNLALLPEIVVANHVDGFETDFVYTESEEAWLIVRRLGIK